MKGITSICIVFLWASFVLPGKARATFLPLPQIDSLDNVIFDMANAVMNGNTIDVPIFFLSNDIVNAIDFSLKFNEVNLRFNSIVNFNTDLVILSNFNTTDRYLRFTSNSFAFQQIETNSALFAIRFDFIGSGNCNELSATDLNSISVYLNGDPCNYKITEAPPFKVPVADFSNNIPCLGNEVIFNNQTKLINDSVQSWSWDFGNGAVSDSINPTISYSTLGNFTVRLIANSNAGCSDTISKQITVNPSPAANFTYVSDCSSGNTVFTDLSTLSSAGIKDWNWNFAEESTSNLPNPVYNFKYGGNHSVSLTITTDSGCTSTFDNSIFVNSLSSIFGAQNGCIGETVTFTDSSTATNSSGSITNWKWYFGDGTTSTLQNPVHSYTNAGTYNAALKVSNLNCADSAISSIIIENKPIVNFTADTTSGCMPLSISFSDASIVESSSTYFWQFENRTDTTTVKTTSHKFKENGNYTVKLIVTTEAGCTDSLEKTDFIKVEGVTASFLASSYKVKLPNAAIRFINHSNSYNNWTWNFGDSIYSSDKTPEHDYEEAGLYKVCLLGLNANGCSSSFCDTIIVENPNIIAFPEAFTPNGDNINDMFKLRGGPLLEMELRIFNEWGNQVFSSNSQNIGWDGSFNGSPQPIGVYEYSLKGKGPDNEIVNMHGIVNLIR